MELIIIFVVITFLIGTISLAVPSKSSRKISNLRMEASRLGFKIIPSNLSTLSFKNKDFSLACYHFKNETNAGIIGFIAGSLGVVWPWKTPIFERDALGEIQYDRVGDPILQNYDRYIPHEFSTHNITAALFILLGIISVMALSKYGENTRV